MIKLPKKEDRFYVLFNQSTELVCQTVKKLEELMQQNSVSQEDNDYMHRLEHEADDVTTSIMEHLNATFITPLDREDICTLAQGLDDIVDYAEGTIERMQLYRTNKPSLGAHELSHLVYEAALQIQRAFLNLNNIKFKKAEIIKATEEIYKLESAGDRIYRQEVARLFEYEKDPVEIIKWKEILEHIETALDHCEDIADLLKGVVLKYE